MNGMSYAVRRWRLAVNEFAGRNESVKSFWLVPAVLFMISGINVGMASGATWFDAASTALALSDLFCWCVFLASINDIECDIRMKIIRRRKAG